jgi:hypothetical protein
MNTHSDGETAQMLADEFSRIIRDWLTPTQMAQVLRRNESNPPDACATHDFCDANMAMTEAFALFFKRRCDPNSASDSALWSAAWALAKSAGFPRKVALIQDAYGVPVYAVPIRDQWIENPRRSACGRFAVDPEQHHGLRAEEIAALDDANSQLRNDRADESSPTAASDSSRRDDERIHNAIANVCRSYPNTEKHSEGDRFVFVLRCEDGSSLLITKCCDEEARPDDAIEVAVGRCAANGDVVEEKILPIDQLDSWIAARFQA